VLGCKASLGPEERGVHQTYVDRRRTRGTQQTSAYKQPACLQPLKAGQKWSDARCPEQMAYFAARIRFAGWPGKERTGHGRAS
jgi:hypothetical protein